MTARGPAAGSPTAILLVSCLDRPGLVASVSDFVFRHDGNILHVEQHVDREDGVFFQRVEFEVAQLAAAARRAPGRVHAPRGPVRDGVAAARVR